MNASQVLISWELYTAILINWWILFSTDELRFVMKNIDDKMTEEEVEELLREADHDGDGKINYDGNY